MKYRAERLGSLIQSELSKLIERIVETPGALLTITEVELNKKMDYALVRVSVYPSEKAEEALKSLQKHSREIYGLLMKKIQIRALPRIAYKLDYGPEKAAAIEKISLEVEKKESAQ